MEQAVKAAPFKVLVVEDEPDLRDLLEYNLKAAGYEVAAAGEGGQALEVARTFAPGLVLLDLMLPDRSGIEVCRSLRSGPRSEQPAIIMLTAKGEEIDRVVGFEIGADDYVVKPFSVRELLLRVRAVLRRRAGAETAETVLQPPAARTRRVLRVGPLTVDVDGHHVYVAGEEVHVSAMEMRLLVYLLEHRGRVRSRENLLEDVWHYRPGVSTRTVDTHVKRLRDKLGEAGPIVETVRGTGYRLSDAHPVHEGEEPDA